jgi:hypothetical protein
VNRNHQELIVLLTVLATASTEVMWKVSNMCQIPNVSVCDNLQTSEILLMKFDNREFH